MSYNVRGLSDKTKRNEVFCWLKQKNAAIYYLSETHSTLECEQIWKDEWSGEIIFSHFSSQARGTAILFKKDLPILIHASHADSLGRCVILDVEINGFRLTLCSVYAPNNDDPNFFLSLSEQIEKYPNDNRIIAGDFNLILDIDLDKRGGTRQTHAQALAVLKNYMEETELVDIWRFQHPSEFRFTWHRNKPYKVSCRLDFFLINYGMTEKITSTSIGAGFRSDHSPIFLSFLPFASMRGRGFWKLNCSLLSDTEYVQKIKKLIKSIAEDNFGTEPRLLWDTIKTVIRGESIKYSSSIKKSMNKKITQLEKSISELELQINLTEDDQILNEQLEAMQIELSNIIKIKTKGAIIRSRLQNFEEGEKILHTFLI